LAAVGGELHSFTDTQDGWLLSEEENSVHAVLFRRDFRDYYERQGWSVYTTHNIGGILQFSGRYQWDEFSSLDPEVEWGLFGDNLGRSSFRPNPALEAQQIHSLRTDLQLDTRDRRSNPRRGWFANALFERAGGFLGGDARFKRYLGDVRRYQPLSSGARMDLRLRLGTAKGALPQQYLYTLGGFGSLRGFDFKEFRGDRMVLINAEYWIDAERQWHSDLPIDGLHLGAFVDAGSTWYADDADNPFDQVDQLVSDSSRDDELKWQTNVGLAAGLGDGISIYASRPLKHQESWMLMLRFSRSL
ncbi:MAG: BamA/TamA family outer membrane protein, partial [Gemmatimonadetes bacterium]|nr:BamA/TamA family outer membrane protein [Gemmatimonadota bacterium]